jgi:hypothetical protein
MSIATLLLRPPRITIGRAWAAIAPNRRRARQTAEDAQGFIPNPGPSRTARSSIPDAVGSKTARSVEIERLLSQTRTPEAAVSFLRGITALSVPAGV